MDMNRKQNFWHIKLWKSFFFWKATLVGFTYMAVIRLRKWLLENTRGKSPASQTSIPFILEASNWVSVPGGVFGISSDGDDRRIFWGLKFSIPGFFWVRKFGLGSLIWVGIFGGIKKNQMRERIYSDGMMNIQTRVFNFQCFSLCYSITPFWNF